MLERRAKLQEILSSAYGDLEKIAVPDFGPDPTKPEEKIYIKITKDAGDFVYILKLENLDSKGRPIKEMVDGEWVPIYNWYVGETNNVIKRWIEHETRFYIDNLEFEKIKEVGREHRFDIYEAWEMENKKLGQHDSEFQEFTCGSDWTALHKPIEIFYLEKLDTVFKQPDARRAARKERENVLTNFMFLKAGTDNVRGGHWCRVGGVGKAKTNEYASKSQGFIRDADIFEHIEMEEGIFEQEQKDYVQGINNIGRRLSEDIDTKIKKLQESDIKPWEISKLKGLVGWIAKKKAGVIDTSKGTTFMALDKFLSSVEEIIKEEYPDGFKDENGKIYTSIKRFVADTIYALKTSNDHWYRDPGREWSSIGPIFIEKFQNILCEMNRIKCEGLDFVKLDLGEFDENNKRKIEKINYSVPQKDQWIGYLREYDCNMIEDYHKWMRDQFVKKLKYLRDEYAKGLSQADILRVKQPDDPLDMPGQPQNLVEPKKTRRSKRFPEKNKTEGLYFKSPGSVNKYLRDHGSGLLMSPENKIVRQEDFYINCVITAGHEDTVASIAEEYIDEKNMPKGYTSKVETLLKINNNTKFFNRETKLPLFNPEEVLPSGLRINIPGVVPAIYSRDIVGDPDELTNTRNINIERHEQTEKLWEEYLPGQGYEIAPKKQKIMEKNEYIKSIFSSDNFYGLCLEKYTLGDIQRNSGGLFATVYDVAFSFYKFFDPIKIRPQSDTLKNMLILQDAHSIPVSEGEAKRYGIDLRRLEEVDTEDVHQIVTVKIRGWAAAVLKNLETVKIELVGIATQARNSPLGPSPGGLMTIRGDPKLNKFFDNDEKIEEFFNGDCSYSLREVRTTRSQEKRKFLTLQDYFESYDVSFPDDTEELEPPEEEGLENEALAGFSRWLMLKKISLKTGI